MAWQDDIAVKRQELATKKASQSLHDESIDAILGGSENVVSSTDKLADKDDIDNVIKQLKELQLTNLLQANKPEPPKPMNITDSAAYVGDSIEKLGTKLMAKLDDDSLDKDTLQAVKELKPLLDALQSNIKSIDATKQLAKLQKAIDNLEVQPKVNVAAPKVTVQAPKTDFAPLIDILKQQNTEDEGEEKLDLDDYRAQDIDNTNPNMQYIGFVNPAGNWYIIENDVAGNRMRYVFGTSGYEEAFANAAMYTYSLLNEAVNALSA